MKRNQELIDKYPKFFERTGGCAIDCRDGWFKIVDDLMGCIYQYCEDHINSDTYGKSVIDGAFVFPSVTTVKEKFGSLSFYMDTGDQNIHGMIQLASYLSRRTCEFCGRTINVGRTYGVWIYTVCETCREANPKVKELEWSPTER